MVGISLPISIVRSCAIQSQYGFWSHVFGFCDMSMKLLSAYEDEFEQVRFQVCQPRPSFPSFHWLLCFATKCRISHICPKRCILLRQLFGETALQTSRICLRRLRGNPAAGTYRCKQQSTQSNCQGVLRMPFPTGPRCLHLMLVFTRCLPCVMPKRFTILRTVSPNH